MKRFLAFLLLLVVCFNIHATKAYWIIFKDKKGSNGEETTFSSDTIDFPLSVSYVDQVSAIARRLPGESRWLNALPVKATAAQLKKILCLPFVDGAEEIAEKAIPAAVKRKYKQEKGKDVQSLMQGQIARMNGQKFNAAGIDGRGIRVAVLDGGFPQVNTHPAFQHLRDNHQIIKTWDFTKDNPYVYRGNSHGTKVLSCIAGKDGDRLLGLATGAEFLLAITEVNAEPFMEEINWMQAVEWAYRNGANIISSSLGYHKKRYFPEDMNGKISLVAKAALIAARKGILVVNAAGNDGDNKWHVISTPADADSILTVGGISPETNFHEFFSSFGPTADGRMKPNVCSYSTAIVADGAYSYASMQGTSFAAPLISGFVACVWQLNHSMNNMEIKNAVEKSSHLYPYFDYAHGYGVPNADYFLQKETIKKEPTFEFVEEGDLIHVKVLDPFLSLLTTSAVLQMYYNFEQNNGLLKEYGIIKVSQDKLFSFDKEQLRTQSVKKINIYFLNYTASYVIR